jgi:hypothetical protein
LTTLSGRRKRTDLANAFANSPLARHIALTSEIQKYLATSPFKEPLSIQDYDRNPITGVTRAEPQTQPADDNHTRLTAPGAKNFVRGYLAANPLANANECERAARGAGKKGVRAAIRSAYRDVLNEQGREVKRGPKGPRSR